MEISNVMRVKDFYAAYARGDDQAAIDMLSPDIVWMEAESHPFADQNPYVGPAAVIKGVLERVAATWIQNVVVTEVLPVGLNKVLVSCRYVGKNIQTGKALDAQVAHIWTVSDGKLSSFQQHADTHQIVNSTLP